MNFNLVRVGDVVSFQNGYAFKSKDFTQNGFFKIIKIKELKNGKIKFFSDSARININDENILNKYKVENGDILFALTGDPISKNNPLSWVGRISIYKNKDIALLNQRVCRAIFSNKIDSKYFYYYFRVFENFFSLASKATGSASQANISTKTIEESFIQLPPLETQKKIASILSALDDKIELNNKINENLEMQAQAIFKSWFVDFENIERVTCHANEYFDISIGKTPPRKEHEWFSNNKFDNIKWVSISDMGNCGIYINDSSEYLTRKAIDKFNIKIVPKNTILLSFKLTIGRIAITNDIMATNEAIAHFKTKNQNIIEYLYCYLKNFNFQELGSTSSIATAVNSKIIKSMPFTIPTNKELANFHNVTNGMFNEIRKNQEENQRLAELRDTLLPKLMNGEIDVDDVQV